MKFRVQASVLNEAMDVLSVAPPRAVSNKGETGYLFVVNGEKCRIHSQGAEQQALVEIPISDVDGEGAFVFPADKVSSLKYLDGWLSIEAGHTTTPEDRHWIKYGSEGGALAERSTHDPRLIQSVDKGLATAKIERTFPVKVLAAAISMARAYVAKPNDNRAPDVNKTMQLFDDSKKEWAKGDGVVFAADHLRQFFFKCESFRGKGLAIHCQHLSQLTSFLNKCEGDITIKLGDACSYAINSKGQVFGWAHHVKQHEEYKYYTLKWDKFILRTPKDLVVRALRYVRSELDPKKSKIRVVYDHVNKTLQFLASEGAGKFSSVPVGVAVIEEADAGKEGTSKSFQRNANVDHLLDLFEPTQVNEVTLRVAIVSADGKESGLFRTIEQFWMNAAGKVVPGPGEDTYECQVTRFMPSMD